MPNSPHVAPEPPSNDSMQSLRASTLGEADRGTFKAPGLRTSPRRKHYQHMEEGAQAQNIQQLLLGEILDDGPLASPYDEGTFTFDNPRTTQTSRSINTSPQLTPKKSRPALMKEGSFGFGLPLPQTPMRKKSVVELSLARVEGKAPDSPRRSRRINHQKGEGMQRTTSNLSLG